MRYRGFIFVAIAGTVAVASYIGWQQFGLSHVTLAEISRGPAIRAVYATGVVEPVQWAKVTPLVRGRIADICRCEGADVPEGAELARLDDSAERARLDELQARVTFLAQETARYRALAERGTASVQILQQRQSELLQAQAAVNAQRELVGHFVLRAPMDGVVLRRDGEVGEIAEPGDILFWVGQLHPLWVVADVDEEDIPLVEPQQRVYFKADAFPDGDLTGTVQQITPKGDPVNKSYRVRIALPEDTPLRIGMTVETNIVVQRIAETLLIPVSALRADAEGRFVFVAANGRAELRRVTAGIIGTGASADDRAEIVAGLTAGEHIVADPPSTLGDGDRIAEQR